MSLVDAPRARVMADCSAECGAQQDVLPHSKERTSHLSKMGSFVVTIRLCHDVPDSQNCGNYIVDLYHKVVWFYSTKVSISVANSYSIDYHAFENSFTLHKWST